MDHVFSAFARRLKPSAIRQLTKVLHGKKVISFAGGLPQPDTLPSRELAALAAEILAAKPMDALQYGLTQGYAPLIEQVIAYLGGRGFAGLKPENVLIAAGSQQAIDLAARIFIDPGDTVLVDAPGYTGAFTVFDHLGARMLGVPVQADGPDLDYLESLLKRERAKFYYTTLNFANPSGVLVPQAKRRALYELARRFDLWIVEDDAYGDLCFAETSPDELVPLKANDPDGRVVYMQTFSKTIAPGLRVASMVASPKVITLIELAKQGADMFTGTLSQVLAAEVLRRGIFAARLPGLRETYQARRDAMEQGLRAHLPGGAWVTPKGGFFYWLQLPAGVDSEVLLNTCMDAGMAFVPGPGFFVDRQGSNAARLSYSRESPEKILKGLQILGQAVERQREPVANLG